MLNTSRIVTLFIFLATTIAFFSSCKDNFDPTTELNGTVADIQAMLTSEDITQRASIDSDNFIFTSSAGTVVTAKPNSFVFENDAFAQGLIDFEMIELFTKSDILRYGIQTLTFRGEILESDGEFFFSASQNGEPLTLAPQAILELTVPNDEPNEQMQLFQGVEGLWGLTDIPVNAIVVSSDTTDNVFNGYETFSDRLRWVNIDYFTKFDEELVDISICLPAGYADDEISLSIIFKDLDIVLNSSGQNLPVGEEVYVVVIAAEDEDTFRMDIQEVTIAADLKVNLDPERVDEEELKKRLKELD